jgi:transposase
MNFVGVDIAKSDHCLGAIDAQGKVVVKPQRFAHTAEGFAMLAAILGGLGGPSAVTVGCEATGHYWVLLAEELSRLGYRLQVFNPIISADAGRRSVRGRKTDEDDCLVIAKVLRDGGFSAVALPDEKAGRLKRLVRHRQNAVERCANLKKRLVGLLDLVFPEFGDLFSDPYGPTARMLLSRAPSARLLASVKPSQFTQRVRKVSHGRLGLERIQAVVAAARISLAAARTDEATELAVRMTIQEIDLLEQQIATYEAEIEHNVPEQSALLTTIPGIGTILAAVIMAEIGTITAFIPRPGDGHTSDGIHRLLAFAGLDPRIRSSGQWTGKVRMSKRGSSTLRTAIWRAAFIASRHPAFAPMYHKHRVEMKQPFLVAISHVARKVTQAIYGVLRHQTVFNEEAFAKGPKKAAA